ncbi:MAG TPA: O-sialoglycoprotein endopeptidase, partial [Verrucomicrobiae bacterium]|nr:O-sialoglycoprotein endopeptidase [Verrucomicrobiae bacterium]
MAIFLGVDTSCYTTSVAAVDSDGKLLADKRKVLDVKFGERGLQQSEAVFQHVQNLPVLLAELLDAIDVDLVQGIAASSRPRPVEGSYMPVFTAGMGQAQIAGKLLGCKFNPTSH